MTMKNRKQSKRPTVKKVYFNMKVALVHDYLKENGGAERVLKVLTEIYPKAPIYTAFSVKGSTAEKLFRGAEIHESWLAPILKIKSLYSPLRFLIPWIWGSFDLSDYDLVITSASWYITRGFKTGKEDLPAGRQTKVICYCHTPPRWLYGYDTSVNFQKYWPVKIYAVIVGHFLRMYDFNVSQKINYWIANSKNVAERIWKFYRKKSVVIYPPVDTKNIIKYCHAEFSSASEILKRVQDDRIVSKPYFLIVSRIVGAKGIENAIRAFQSKSMSKYKLKIVGESHGYSNIEYELRGSSGGNTRLQASGAPVTGGQGFVALAKEEDFGMTVVEAQAAGCPVIAYNGGGFKESVISGVTGLLINNTDEKTLKNAIEQFNKIKWDKNKIMENAKRFSKERFEKELRIYIKKINAY